MGFYFLSGVAGKGCGKIRGGGSGARPVGEREKGGPPGKGASVVHHHRQELGVTDRSLFFIACRLRSLFLASNPGAGCLGCRAEVARWPALLGKEACLRDPGLMTSTRFRPPAS